MKIEISTILIKIGMGLGQNFAAQGQFGPGLLWAGPRLGPISNLTFGPGPGLDFPSLGWIGPWAIQIFKIGPLLGHFWASLGQPKTRFITFYVILFH